MEFEFATAQRIRFGPGLANELGTIAASFGTPAFILTGANRHRWDSILDSFMAEGLPFTAFGVSGEPTTETAAAAVASARQAKAEVVVAIGGGSVIDTGKVVAAMLTNAGAIEDYLEVVGAGKPLLKESAPYIAAPTTAGTGAEVTRNAVLAVPDKEVKVSMRSPLMLPKMALIDPLLTHAMPPDLTAATGLDALTQLVEAFVSRKANPLTDGLCREGLRRAGRSLRRAFDDGQDAEARCDMALASLFSGLALANAKLGAVHGFAGPLGGMLGAPHGVICGKLLPHVTAANVAALRDRAASSAALARFDEIAGILTGQPSARASDAVSWIQALCAHLRLPGLRQYGLADALFPAAVAKAEQASSMKGNPIELTEAELTEILAAAID